MDTKSKNCLYCDYITHGNYCSHCGQATNTSRLNAKDILLELQNYFLRINKGILYTIKELIIRPGVTINNYIIGKRAMYSNPLALLILSGVLYNLALYYFDYSPIENTDQNNEIDEYIPISQWFSKNYSNILLSFVPFYALASFLIFRKNGYNYIEHLVINSYLIGAKTFILLLLFPLVYITKSDAIHSLTINVTNLYLIFGLVIFFRSTSYIKTTLKAILCLISTTLIILALISILFETLQRYNIRL